MQSKASFDRWAFTFRTLTRRLLSSRNLSPQTRVTAGNCRASSNQPLSTQNHIVSIRGKSNTTNGGFQAQRKRGSFSIWNGLERSGTLNIGNHTANTNPVVLHMGF